MAEEAVAVETANQVVLRGRVTSQPLTRELPSGASIVSFRVAMTRDRTAMTVGSRQASDWVDCVAWAARPRKSVSAWRVGDTVEVEGSLRRRFFRQGEGSASRVEVEVLKGRMVQRA